jgi:hypothetical protein
MANIALNKLPIEANSWIRPEEATNGKIKGYDGNNGFAHKTWPCTYTLDFSEEKAIKTIRFLLWDGLGANANTPNPRKYTFTLSVSLDDSTYITIFSNKETQGGNGWYIFNLLSDTYVRYVRLEGHSNTANGGFHIVEFEVHDRVPDEVASTNQQKISVNISVPSETKIAQLVDKIFQDKSKILQSLEGKINTADDAYKKFSESIAQANIVDLNRHFIDEANRRNLVIAKRWLYASIGIAILFFVLLTYLVFCDTTPYVKILQYECNPITKPYTKIILWAYFAGKALVFSSLLFILSWTLKSYRAEMHNYVVNKHKAMVFSTATSILVKEDLKNTDHKQVFNEAVRTIFEHQSSGFLTGDKASPNIINSMFQKPMSNEDA